jgi:hypothetical protein
MAPSAGASTDLQPAPFAHNVAVAFDQEGENTLARSGEPEALRRRTGCRRRPKTRFAFKNKLASRNPILFCVEFGRIEDDLRLPLFQRFYVPRRLAAFDIRRVRAIDGPYFELVILLRRHLARRAIPLRQWHFEVCDLFVVPRLWNDPRSAKQCPVPIQPPLECFRCAVADGAASTKRSAAYRALGAFKNSARGHVAGVTPGAREAACLHDPLRAHIIAGEKMKEESLDTG